MPQLAIETWVTQYFWLMLIIGVFYWIMRNWVVVKLSAINKIRNRISSPDTLTAVSEEYTSAAPEVLMNGPFNNTK